MHGKKIWFFPDGDRPPEGSSLMKGHESYIILNPNNQDAHIVLPCILKIKILSGISG